MRFRHVGRLIGLAAAGLFAVSACDDETTTGVPVAESMVSSAGDNQSGTVASVLPTSLEVTVTGSNGQPFSGATVQFTVQSRTGSVNPASATTGSDGKASTSLTLGTIAERVSVEARVGELTAEFSATALAGPVASVEKIGGDAQDGGVGQTLTTTLSVELRDAHGNPVPGIAVDWTSPEGGTFANQASDATGTARAAWTLANVGGGQTAEASAGGVSVDFTARAFDCNPVAYTVGTTVNGSLLTTGESCPLPSGAFAEFYSVSSAAVVANSFDLASGAFGPLITMEASDGNVFAIAPSPFVAGATLVRVIQGADDYLLTVTSAAPGATGAFQLTSAAANVDNDAGCAPGSVFSADGVLSSQNLTAADCFFFDPWYSDWFAVYLETGDEASIAMTSTAMDTYLQLIDPGFNAVIDFDDDGGPGTSSLLVHTATETGAFIVDASTFDPATTGLYTMQITVTRSGSAPLARTALRAGPAQLNPQLKRVTKVKQ